MSLQKKTVCADWITFIGKTDYVKTRFGFEGYGCGLCQTGVPCESAIPTGANRIR